MIGGAGALILYSGSRALFDRHSSALEALAESRHLGEDEGLASLYDIALLSGMYGLFSGFLHASALVTSAGGKAVDFLPLLLPWIEAMSGTPARPPGKSIAACTAAMSSPTSPCRRSRSRNIVRASEEQGVAPVFMQPMLRLAGDRVDRWGPRRDNLRRLEVIRKRK